VSTPAVGRAAPARSHGLDDGAGGAAPPVDPEDTDDGELDAADVDAAAAGEERAGPWVPDAELMQAFGLELPEAEEASVVRRGDGEPAAVASCDRVSASATCDGRPPWW
jgi:hypothetical protein